MGWLRNQVSVMRPDMKREAGIYARSVLLDFLFLFFMWLVALLVALLVNVLSSGLYARIKNVNLLTQEDFITSSDVIQQVFFYALLLLAASIVFSFLAYSFTRVFVWNAVSGKKTSKGEFLRFSIGSLVSALAAALIFFIPIRYMVTAPGARPNIAMVLLLAVLFVLWSHISMGIYLGLAREKRIGKGFGAAWKAARKLPDLALAYLSFIAGLLLLGVLSNLLFTYVKLPFLSFFVTLVLGFSLLAWLRISFCKFNNFKVGKSEEAEFNKKEKKHMKSKTYARTHLRYCEECGTKIKEGSNFCEGCGKALKTFSVGKKLTLRPTFLTIYLVIMLISNAFSLLVSLFMKPLLIPFVLLWFVIIWALFNWKMWGFYGAILLSGLGVVLSPIINKTIYEKSSLNPTLMFVTILLSSFIGMIILYLAMRPVWDYFD